LAPLTESGPVLIEAVVKAFEPSRLTDYKVEPNREKIALKVFGKKSAKTSETCVTTCAATEGFWIHRPCHDFLE
jgi:hypothetical protein